MSDELLTTEEAAARAKVSRATFQKLVNSGKIKARTIEGYPRLIRFAPADVDAMFKETAK